MLPLTHEHLLDIEQAVASDTPFGAWQDIVNRTLTFYERSLEILAPKLSGAADLLAAVQKASAERRYRVLGDPVVRTAINGVLGRFRRERSKARTKRKMSCARWWRFLSRRPGWFFGGGRPLRAANRRSPLSGRGLERRTQRDGHFTAVQATV